jgi:hypothetical protein
MISDLTIGDTVDTLQEYYDSVYELQSTAHKPDYMLVHAEIKEKMKECDSYTELGVNQGATLAAAMLENPKIVRAYDISLMPYNKAKHHFESYAADYSINYNVVEGDTLTSTLEQVDLLYIDTLHRYDHLTKELALHGNKANKYIIFHDTQAQRGLKQAVQEYVQKNPEWTIVTDCQDNVGFMTIGKII